MRNGLLLFLLFLFFLVVFVSCLFLKLLFVNLEVNLGDSTVIALGEFHLVSPAPPQDLLPAVGAVLGKGRQIFDSV